MKDYETRLRKLRAQIDAADAEIEAGQGIAFADARALTDEIVRQGKAALGRDRRMSERT